MRNTVFLTLEPYLAQWLAHESGGKDPIPIKRGSAEADLLRCFLKPQPRDPDFMPQVAPLPGQVEILLPAFKNLDTRIYNYLPPRGEVCLHQCIRHRFKVNLWKDLYTIGNIVQRTDLAILDWMEAHGIQDTETNWNTIAKIMQRTRAAYCKLGRLTNHKSSKHRKRRKRMNNDQNPPHFEDLESEYDEIL